MLYLVLKLVVFADIIFIRDVAVVVGGRAVVVVGWYCCFVAVAFVFVVAWVVDLEPVTLECCISYCLYLVPKFIVFPSFFCALEHEHTNTHTHTRTLTLAHTLTLALE